MGEYISLRHFFFKDQINDQKYLLHCCATRTAVNDPLLSFVLVSLAHSTHNFNLLCRAISSPVIPSWFPST